MFFKHLRTEVVSEFFKHVVIELELVYFKHLGIELQSKFICIFSSILALCLQYLFYWVKPNDLSHYHSKGNL